MRLNYSVQRNQLYLEEYVIYDLKRSLCLA